METAIFFGHQYSMLYLGENLFLEGNWLIEFLTRKLQHLTLEYNEYRCEDLTFVMRVSTRDLSFLGRDQNMEIFGAVEGSKGIGLIVNSETNTKKSSSMANDDKLTSSYRIKLFNIG